MTDTEKLDVVIIGAGVSGLYSLYRFRKLGLSARILEQGDGVGGVWFWNRYPGCRFDTPSPEYSYSFSPELPQEWDWEELFSPQPHNERYVNRVAEKFDLFKDIRLNTRVSSLVWEDESRRWRVTADNGTQLLARFVVTAVGRYSSSFKPDFLGIDSFKGTWLHSGRWPKGGIDLTGKRVAVIGTASTGVQIITEVAKIASKLTVFQRTAGYCVPMDNRPIPLEEMAQIKAQYTEMFRVCDAEGNGAVHKPMAQSAFEFTPEERLAMYEEAWKLPGTAKYNTLFREISQPGLINDEYAEFVRHKIREQIKDPKLQEKLVPTDHPFRSKRMPRVDGYYETYARDNVELVSVKEDPIEGLTASGIKTRDAHHPADVVVFATGWDVVTGPLLAMDIRGVGGEQLRDHFANGYSAYLFLQSVGFPNLFFLNSAFTGGGAYVRSLEWMVDWLGDVLCDVLGRGYTEIVPKPEVEEAWMRYATEMANKTIFAKSNSSYLGGNIPGKPKIPLSPVGQSEANMRKRRLAESTGGFPSFNLR